MLGADDIHYLAFRFLAIRKKRQSEAEAYSVPLSYSESGWRSLDVVRCDNRDGGLEDSEGWWQTLCPSNMRFIFNVFLSLSFVDSVSRNHI